MFVTKRDGRKEPLEMSKYEAQIEWACKGLEGVDSSVLRAKARKPLYPGISTKDLNIQLRKAAIDLVTPQTPNYTFVAARLTLQDIYKEVAGEFQYPRLYDYLRTAIAEANLDPVMIEPTMFDEASLEAVIKPSRDFSFDYLGLSTVADRYLLRNQHRKLIEMPQHWLMRVAMGVARDEQTIEARTTKAISYYEALSTLRFMSSTPTLFNSSLKRSQLSSCFGIHMGDDFDSIFDSLKEAGAYSKYGGGVAMDYTMIRSKGSPIISMGGEAGGPIPYIKLFQDTLIGFDQQGKRKGSGVAYMEPWHADIEDFLALREPGDDRLRTHDLFTALWIPDLFMSRVVNNEYWSLFDPRETPDLHDKHGAEFTAAYEEYEKKGIAKKVLPAEELWQTILTRLFAHGVFWPCFKDRMNARYTMPYPIRSSNLCTEIALRSDDENSFVCNLGSINLSSDELLLKRGADGKFLWNDELSKVVRTAVRFLDSVISVGYVPSKRGANFQQADRPIGMGCMGWTTALYKMGIDYESKQHIEYANEVYKQISITATHESAMLAREKGSFPTFAESGWARGELIHDTLDNRRVVEEFDLDLTIDHCPFVKMDELRELVKGGMRNSTLLAIAPTATISNIVGAEQCTELPWDEVFDKKNLSGVFKAVNKNTTNNPFGLPIKTAFMVDHTWTVKAAAARQIWIDQSQSTNFFVDTSKPDAGDKVDDLYMNAWEYGLKTTYYLYGRAEETEAQSSPLDHLPEPEVVGAVCTMRPGDPGFDQCEACQ